MDLNFNAEQEKTEKGQKCPYCHDVVEALPTNAECATCRAVHHPECWEAHEKCSSCGHSSKIQTQIESLPKPSLGPKKRCQKLFCQGLALNDARFPEFADLCKAHGFILWKHQYETGISTVNPAVPGALTILLALVWVGTGSILPLIGALITAILTWSARSLRNKWSHDCRPWPTSGQVNGKLKATSGPSLGDMSRKSHCGCCGDPFDLSQETLDCEKCGAIHHTECQSALHICPGCDLKKAVSYRPSDWMQQITSSPPTGRSVCEVPGCVEAVDPWDGRSMKIDKCEEHSKAQKEDLSLFLTRTVQGLPALTVVVALLAYFHSPKPGRAAFFMSLGGTLLWGFFIFLKRYYQYPPKDPS